MCEFIAQSAQRLITCMKNSPLAILMLINKRENYSMNGNHTAGTGNAPYGTGPGFGAKGSGPVLDPNHLGPGSDMPIGLSMLLMEDMQAMQRFAAMPKEEKLQVLKYVESGVNGEDAQRRILHTVKCLHDGTPGFYLQG